ncbi:HEAT repeat domain-containing protein [Actinoplanes sp. NPDC089786]|uniref:NACHT domain-containing protein n=1 Tax=Actinoplanes sp. NPDC089786 TaxID=3155185 RepID=UPI0034243916
MTVPPRRRPILIAHAQGDEEQAERLAAPLVAAGYEVVHSGTVLVGESLVAEAGRVLTSGGPVVLCGTARAAGSRWAHRLVHATRRYSGVRVFGLEMDEEAYLEPLTLDAAIAAYWLDPGRAVQQLLAALARHYPVDPSAEPADEAEARAEAAYRNLLLDACDLIHLTNLPSDRRTATRQLMLRTLFVPLKVRVEREAGDPPDAGGLTAIERRRATSGGGSPDSGSPGSDRSRPTGAQSASRDVPVGPGARLRVSRRLVVLGDPGAGKSTMLRWFATAFLLKLRGDPDWSDLPAVETLPDEDWLPVLVRCRDLSADQLNGPLADMLTHVLRRAELPDHHVDVLRSSLLRRLADGSALLLVDGLDEIADATARARFCEQLERIHLAYPAAPVIVTSRIVGYREMGYRIGRGFEHVTLAELGRRDKDDFIRRWCALNEPPDRHKAIAAEISKDIHGTDRIERLTGSPMLLTTMVLVKRTVGKLPEHRADLYREAIKVLLNWRPEVDRPVDAREAVPQLGYMAYDMSVRGAQQITDDDLITLLARIRDEYPTQYSVAQRTPAQFIQLMENRTGLLTEAGRVHDVPVFEFRHLTFQEYLAARALVKRCFPGKDPDRGLADDIAVLATRLDDPVPSDSSADRSWQEAVRLAVTLCPDDDVDPVLRAILGPDDGDPASSTPRTVFAARCLQDEPNAGPDAARTVLRRLVRTLPFDGPEREIHDAVRSLASSRWSGELVSHLLTEFRTQSGNASTDLVALIGEVIGRSAPNAPDELASWQEARIQDLAADDRETVLRAALIIGHLTFGDDRAAARLLDLLHGVDELAVTAAWALGRLADNAETCAWRLTDNQARSIQRTIDPAAMPASRLVLLTRVLGARRWTEAVDPLVNAARDADPLVRAAAVRRLGTSGLTSVIPHVIARLEDEVASVRAAAARALASVPADSAVPPLMRCLSDDDPKVRSAAAEIAERFPRSSPPSARASATRPDTSLKPSVTWGAAKRAPPCSTR